MWETFILRYDFLLNLPNMYIIIVFLAWNPIFLSTVHFYFMIRKLWNLMDQRGEIRSALFWPSVFGIYVVLRMNRSSFVIFSWDKFEFMFTNSLLCTWSSPVIFMIRMLNLIAVVLMYDNSNTDIEIFQLATTIM